MYAILNEESYYIQLLCQMVKFKFKLYVRIKVELFLYWCLHLFWLKFISQWHDPVDLRLDIHVPFFCYLYISFALYVKYLYHGFPS
jgi:hypothetical protein